MFGQNITDPAGHMAGYSSAVVALPVGGSGHLGPCSSSEDQILKRRKPAMTDVRGKSSGRMNRGLAFCSLESAAGDAPGA